MILPNYAAATSMQKLSAHSCEMSQFYFLASPIAKTLGSMSIRYRSDTIVSDRYIINTDAKVFDIGDFCLKCTIPSINCKSSFAIENLYKIPQPIIESINQHCVFSILITGILLYNIEVKKALITIQAYPATLYE